MQLKNQKYYLTRIKDTFGMPKILYPCKSEYPPIVTILIIYIGAELNGIVYFQYYVSLWFALISKAISKINSSSYTFKTKFHRDTFKTEEIVFVTTDGHTDRRIELLRFLCWCRFSINIFYRVAYISLCVLQAPVQI